MKRKELTKTFMMTSNRKKLFDLLVTIQRFKLNLCYQLLCFELYSSTNQQPGIVSTGPQPVGDRIKQSCLFFFSFFNTK